MQKWNPAAEKMIHMKYRLILSFFFPSFNTHGVILDWNLWDVCSSNLVSLTALIYYLIQQLGRGSIPLIVSGTTHTSSQYLSKHVAFMHSFLLLSLLSSSCPPHHHRRRLLPLNPFPFCGSSSDQTNEGDTKLMVTDRNIFIDKIPQPDVCECRWKCKLEQMCLISLWNVIACSRNQHIQRKKTNLEISVYLHRCCHAMAGLVFSPQTQRDYSLTWILTGLKHTLVFELYWLLGRLLKLLIR